MQRERSESVQDIGTSSNSIKDDKDDVPLYYCDRNFFTKLPNTTTKVEGTLYTIISLTVFFIIAEVVGGHLANSLAIMTDAGHMIADLTGFLSSLIAVRLAKRKPTKQFSFGFHRAEVIGASASIILIWALTAVLVYMAIARIASRGYYVNANIMLVTSSISIGFNIVMGIVLYFGKHTNHSHFGASHIKHHHHEDSRSISEHQGKSKTLETIIESHHDSNTPQNLKSRSKEATSATAVSLMTNINIRAAFIHVIGDFVQSIGVLIAATFVKFLEWEIADPICTFVFSVLVMITTFPIVRDSLLILMEAAPRNFPISSVNRDLCSIEGVRDVHSLRIWSLTPDKTAVSVHLDTEDGCDSNHVVHEANEMLRMKYGIFYITVQVQCVCSKSISMQTILTAPASTSSFVRNTEAILDSA